MANYATLKAAIAAAIKQNGNNEVTGNLLQQQLLAMVNSLGIGYQYIGIATPDTNPGTPDQNVFYLASTAGTYANFGALVLADGEISILKYNGAWSKDSTGVASSKSVSKLRQDVAILKTMDEYPQYLGNIANEGIIELYDDAHYIVVPVNPNVPFYIKGGVILSKFAFVKSFDFNHTLPYTLDLCSGSTVVILSSGQEYTSNVPQDAKYLLITALGADGTTRLPVNLSINEWDYVNTDYDFVKEKTVEFEKEIPVIRQDIDNIIDDINFVQQVSTGQVLYVYADDGSRLASQNYNGTTDGLIPVSVGDVISFTGTLSESRHGLLFYSDENTVVATSLINGTFTNEKVVVENPSIKYFRAQALNANYDPGITTLLSVSIYRPINNAVNELDERVTTIEESMSVTPDIIIEKVAAGAFDVKVKQESNGKYLTHRFLRHRYSRLVRYGTTGEATHEEICSDCWYPSQIYDGTTDILQGNANFINYVANKENEQGYVGEGHGATFYDYVHFFADGVEFDPNTLTGQIKCGTFRFVEKNVLYAIDTTQPNFNSDNAIPKFDENGNKEISTIHWFEGVWEKNNTIKYRHRLTIKRDNTQFRYCFGAMLEMEKDNFPHIIINDADGTENLVSYANNQWTCTPVNGSSVVLQSDITNKGDEIVGFGTKYIVRQRMLQALTERAKISSMFPRLYTGVSYRIKFYQQPVVTTANYAAVGLPTETFNNGDVVELFVERNIDFVES